MTRFVFMDHSTSHIQEKEDKIRGNKDLCAAFRPDEEAKKGLVAYFSNVKKVQRRNGPANVSVQPMNTT